MIWIAVDAMGGDDAPRHVIDGALAAARDVDLGVMLVGPTALLDAELRRHAGVDRSRIRLVEAPEVVMMEESPSAALRRKPGASIRIAAETVARGEGGRAVQRGTYRGDRDGGERRVRDAARRGSPRARGHDPDTQPSRRAGRRRRERRVPAAAPPAVRRDGQCVCAVAFGIETPRIGLLSIGEEAAKGNELTRESHRLLKASLPSFIGNVEARDVYRGHADVIVCDGFTGNVALKIGEGLVEVIEGLLSEELSVMTDYSEYGGAPLLGVNGVTIVGHGRSSAKAVRNAVVMAHRFASNRFMQRIEGDIAASAVPHP